MKNSIENLKATLLDEIVNFDHYNLIELNNSYASEIQNNTDNSIYENDPENLDLLFSSNDPYYILCRAFYGEYNPRHDYFQLDGYGNLESFDNLSLDNLCELPETMILDIIENWRYFDHLFSGAANDLYNQIQF